MGHSAGYGRHRADFHADNEHPKRLWLRALDPQARRHLRSAGLPADCQPGGIAPPSGVLPVDRPQLASLFEVLQRAPDPAPRTPVTAAARGWRWSPSGCSPAGGTSPN